MIARIELVKALVAQPNLWFRPRQGYFFFLPKMAEMIMSPTLRSRPERDVGMPVLRANCCLARVMPIARFHEKDIPGIFMTCSVIVVFEYRQMGCEPLVRLSPYLLSLEHRLMAPILPQVEVPVVR